MLQKQSLSFVQDTKKHRPKVVIAGGNAQKTYHRLVVGFYLVISLFDRVGMDQRPVNRTYQV